MDPVDEGEDVPYGKNQALVEDVHLKTWGPPVAAHPLKRLPFLSVASAPFIAVATLRSSYSKRPWCIRGTTSEGMQRPRVGRRGTWCENRCRRREDETKGFSACPGPVPKQTPPAPPVPFALDGNPKELLEYHLVSRSKPRIPRIRKHLFTNIGLRRKSWKAFIDYFNSSSCRATPSPTLRQPRTWKRMPGSDNFPASCTWTRVKDCSSPAPMVSFVQFPGFSPAVLLRYLQ